jgi:hypothetical protein
LDGVATAGNDPVNSGTNWRCRDVLSGRDLDVVSYVVRPLIRERSIAQSSSVVKAQVPESLIWK